MKRRMDEIILQVRGIKHFFNKIDGYEIYQSYLKNQFGIEIGGPTRLFKTRLPIYQVISGLDGVNYANNTIWEGEINSGQTYNYYKDMKGFQYILDATDLQEIQSNQYGFLLSSDCLEHIADPIKAIQEWKRIMKKNGLILLVLPNKESNFDHNRPFTTFGHLLEDYKNNTKEDDLTHLEEILLLHDLKLDPAAGSLENFKTRCNENFTNRALHHHVFDLSLIYDLLEYCDFKIVESNIALQCHISPA